YMDCRRVTACRGLRLFLAAFLVGMLTLTGARPAAAHVDPPTCFRNFVTVGIDVFRADGVTPILPNQTVSPCETIKFRMTISKPATNDFCAFEAGQMFITLPNGEHNVTPGTIPCVGCTLTPGVPSVDSVMQSYTVTATDAMAGSVSASAAYGKPPCLSNPGTCGTAHNSTNDTPNIVNGGQGTVVNVEPCPSTGPICQESFCNPSKTDGIRTGLCDNRNLDNSATDPRCVDTNGPCT